jgi:hypothetical protein
MLFRDIINLYSENPRNLKNTLSEKYIAFNVKEVATYSNQCFLNGYRSCKD